MSEDKEYSKLINNICSLTPHDHDTENEVYIKLIDHAIVERKDVKNIALSGPYGAGKSTILNTFKRYNSNKEEDRKRIVNISMASFCEIVDEADIQAEGGQDVPQDENGQTSSDKPQRNISTTDIKTIEKTILQQLIYSVDKDQIPLSKFSRISKINKGAIKNKILDFFLWILVLVTFYNFSVIKVLFSDFKFINMVYFLLLLLLSFLALYLSVKNIIDIIYYFRRLNLTKVAFKNVELIFADESNSVLNHNIDEILYFFEATETDVVIFEDLDRFEKPEIFVNLRELNNQINSSAQVKQKVSFVYAVKEDMFYNKDRVKFFDLIIPVIPFINSENSYEMIERMIENLGLRDKFTNDFVYGISIYINDMRLLTNIINEFLVYFHKLFYKETNEQINISLEKLLSIIIYKNFHPDDFSKLHKREGDLYKLIHKRKHEFIKTSLKDLNTKIDEVKDSINDSNLFYLESESELNKYLVLDIGQKNNINQILLNGSYQSIVNISESKELLENLLEIDEDRLQCTRFNGQTTFINSSNLINSSKSFIKYGEKIEFIKNKQKEKRNLLTEKLEQLLKEKIDLEAMTINQLVEQNTSSIHIPKSILESEILLYLVSQGYISTDYPSYISLIHDLSEVEIDFIRKVKSSKTTDPSIILNRIDSIFKKLSISDCRKSSILNFSLVEYLFEHKDQNLDKYNALLEVFKKQNQDIIKFVYSYIKLPEVDKSHFIKTLTSIKNDFWNDLVSEESIEYVDEDELLSLLFKYADLEDIIKTNSSTNSITMHINEMANFIRFVVEKKLPIEKVQSYIQHTGARIESLSMPKSNEEKKLFDFICNYNLYFICKDTLQVVSSYYQGKYISFEDAVSYAKLSNLQNKKIIEYIDENIDTFISHAYTQYPHTETNDSLKSIIGNDQLKDAHREAVIEHMDNIFDDISFIDSISWKQLFKYKKIEATWENVLTVYREYENTIPEFIIDYLNEKDVADILKEQSLLHVEGYEEEGDEKFLKDFRYTLYFQSNISNENLRLYRNTSPRCWTELSIDSFEEEKLKTIVMSNYLCTEPINYNNLKNHPHNVDNFHIHLIEKDVESFLKDKAKYDLSYTDIELLLNSLALENSSKIEIFSFDDLEGIDFKINFDFLKYVLSMFLVEHTDKVELIINQMNFLEEDEAIELVSMLNDQFKKITTQKQFELENNELNMALAVSLNEKGYVKDFVPLGGQSAGRLRIRTK